MAVTEYKNKNQTETEEKTKPKNKGGRPKKVRPQKTYGQMLKDSQKPDRKQN